MSCLASRLLGKDRLRRTATGQQTVNLPVWFPTHDLHSHMRLNGEVGLFSPRRPTVVVVLPQTEHKMLPEQNAHPVCQPTWREQTLRRLTEPLDLQALMEQWGSNSLEELEAFIDLYSEMVWERAMGSAQPAAVQDAAAGETGEQLLVSIDRKLSKLDLLEEIRRDLGELRRSLEQSWKAIQELQNKSKQDANDT